MFAQRASQAQSPLWPVSRALYTGWPRKNATTFIVNLKAIINTTELTFISLCGKFIFQQNDTMIIPFLVRRLNPSAILVRQCHFQNLVLFRPHCTLEHNCNSHLMASRSADRALALKTKTMWTNGAIHYATVDSPGRREAKHSCCSKDH